MDRPSLERSLNCSRCSCLPPWRRWEMRSTMMKTVRKVTVNPTPQMVAVFLVRRLIKAVLSQDEEDGEDPDGDVDFAALVAFVDVERDAVLARGAVLEAEERHGHGHEDERPDDAEGVGFAERVDVAEAGEDHDQLEDRDEVDEAMGGAEAFVRMLEPGGEHAVLGKAIEHAVGADHAGVDGAGEDQEADDHDETFHDDLEQRRAGEVLDESVDEVVAISAVVALDVMLGVKHRWSCRSDRHGSSPLASVERLMTIAPIAGVAGIVLAEIIDLDIVLAPGLRRDALLRTTMVLTRLPSGMMKMAKKLMRLVRSME